MDLSKFNSYDYEHYRKFTNPAMIQKDLQSLVGIIEGIKADSITTGEKLGLFNWVSDREQYRHIKPYSQIFPLILEALEDGVLTTEECEDIIWFCKEYLGEGTYYNALTQDIQKLLGVVKGLSIDRLLSVNEVKFLDEWLTQNDHLKNNYPYDELYAFTTYVLAKGSMTEEEHQQALSFMDAIACSSADSSNTLVQTINAEIWQMDPQVIIQEKTFCLTGVSLEFTRKQIAEKIEMYGGYVTDRIVQSLDYLVICAQKNECWAFSAYGRKVEKAINLRRKGHPIAIIHEYDLLDAIADLG